MTMTRTIEAIKVVAGCLIVGLGALSLDVWQVYLPLGAVAIIQVMCWAIDTIDSVGHRLKAVIR